MYVLNKNNIKIYCKFNKTKPPIDKVICKMFCDFTQKKENKNPTQEPCCIHNKNIEKRADKI